MNLRGYDAWKLRAPEDALTEFDQPVRGGRSARRLCRECDEPGPIVLNGARYCRTHYREQSAVLMDAMAALRADEARDDR